MGALTGPLAALVLLLFLQGGLLPPLLGSFPVPNLVLGFVLFLSVLSYDSTTQEQWWRLSSSNITILAAIAGFLLGIFGTDVFWSTVLFMVLAEITRLVTNHWIDSQISLKSFLLVLFLGAVLYPVGLAISSGYGISIQSWAISGILTTIAFASLGFFFYVRT